ncbi:MAG: VWA domain-containing protein [Candidatus Acidiferrales bacterium]
MIFQGPRLIRIRPLRLISQTATALLALLLVSSAIGQAPAPSSPASGAPAPPAAPSPQAQPPTIRVTTHLVQVNVVVKDKKGNPVTDLTKDDFTVLDGNKPQPISVFSMQATHLTAGMTQPLPKNYFTNRFEQHAGIPTSATVVLFDALNTHVQDLAYARQQMLKFIGQLQPQDRVAIFGLAYNLYVLQDFTSDPQALINAVRRSTTPETAHAEATDVQASDTGNDDVDQFLDSMNQMTSDFYNRDRAIRTADALMAIANYIGRVPGRKNLIWVSSAFPISINMDTMMPLTVTAGASYQPDREMFNDQIEAAAQALNDANIAVYPVDARGLMVPSTMNSKIQSSPVNRATRRGQMPPTGAPPQGNFDTMDEIAERTGGRAYYNTNDISGAIRKAIDDSQVTYVLGYYPDHGQWNGKFREIKIIVNRPGMEVRYRRGYFAVSDAPPNPLKRKVLLQDALDSPVDSTTIGMTVEATLAGAPGAQSVKVRIQMDSQAIALVPEADHWNAALDFLMAQWDDKNKVLKAQVRTSQVRITQADRETWDKLGFDIQFEMPLLPGASRVRFAECDEQSGATGSVTIALKSLVPDSH